MKLWESLFYCSCPSRQIKAVTDSCTWTEMTFPLRFVLALTFLRWGTVKGSQRFPQYFTFIWLLLHMALLSSSPSLSSLLFNPNSTRHLRLHLAVASADQLSVVFLIYWDLLAWDAWRRETNWVTASCTCGKKSTDCGVLWEYISVSVTFKYHLQICNSPRIPIYYCLLLNGCLMVGV